jgi:hypothetical protein
MTMIFERIIEVVYIEGRNKKAPYIEGYTGQYLIFKLLSVNGHN